MGFQVRSKDEIDKILRVENIPNIFFERKGPESTPPKYSYDEVGVVIEGEINLRDETGQTAIVRPGDTFFFPRGSTITFSSDSYGVAWKCGGRVLAKI
ncbi:hypothetical protein BO71DRAFT_417333 [Aspergillus ellipticus CBS 707.79]|uniref:(S)-ureidoglycine aminohydrolase cupin domain-containing protein n=1 Tax=Aspergillus ellipticus CBS 707.79 TaxID=1448320 RepID=A0A319E020_9EURO|nr:hypothetical protein BO71DRAFT_417333 [Aspergillus ellipticus CBS 707.79]